jgi:Uncharacterized conserved protein
MKQKGEKILNMLLGIIILSQINLSAQSMSHADTVNGITQKEKTVAVTWENFVCAETDKMFKIYAGMGGFGKFYHLRAVTPLDKQNVVRMNRDTRYSIGIFDLSNPVTVTLPDTKGRFISMQVINEDEFTKAVKYNAGSYTFTEKEIGSRYVCFIIRVMVNSEDENDNQIVTELQNSINYKQAGAGKFEMADWNQQSQDKLRNAINVLASTLTDTKLCFGDVNEVNPIAHLLGAASGWGGNPADAAIYINVVPEINDGKMPYTLTVKNVPVDGFWSVSVYNKDGYFEKNAYNVYSINNVSAIKNNDGSITLHPM